MLLILTIFSLGNIQVYSLSYKQNDASYLSVPTFIREQRHITYSYKNATSFKKHRGRNREKYKTKTEIARTGRPASKLDKKPFVIQKNYLLLKISIVECLHAHNVIRQKHNLSIVLWDPNISYEAEEYALILAARGGTPQHSQQPNDEGLYYGENLWSSSGKNQECSKALEAWYR